MEKGVQLTEKGCEGKDTLSCTNLGALLLTGTGVETDAIRASTLFDQSCKAGSGEACHYLGGQYLLGIGVKTNPELARAHNLTACQRNVSAACGHLGGMLETGFGYAIDLKMAVTMRGRACQAGDAFSCTKLGDIFEEGRGHPVDLKRAGELYLQACRGNEAMGCFNLGELVRKGHLHDTYGSDPNGMYGRSLDLASKACGSGQQLDCLTIADTLAATGKTAEANTLYKNAVPALEADCARGDFTTCLELEDLYKAGLGVEQSEEKAKSYRARACEIGATVACR